MTAEAGGGGGVARSDRKMDLAVVGSMPMAGGLVPRTLEEALQLVKLLADSTLIPVALRGKPSDVYVIIAKGMELGLKPMHALSELFVVEGKPGCSAALKRALCQTSTVCEYFQMIESTSKRCTYEAKRRGAKEPTRMTLTWEDAVTAGLALKDTYKKYPAAMLRAWCSRGLADAEFADVVQGMRNDDDRELPVSGEVLSITPNRRPPQSAGAPVLSDDPVNDDVEPGEEQAPESPEPQNAPEPVPPGEMTEANKLHAEIDIATREQLAKLADRVTKWPDLTEQKALRQHFSRRTNDLKGGK